MDIEKSDGGMVLYLELILSYGIRVKENAVIIQDIIRKEVEDLTGFNITAVNITVKGLV